jgi:hypothetical protein
VRKRKVTYPVAKTSRQPPRTIGDAPILPRPTVADINTTAMQGRGGVVVGAKVRIAGAGLYSGEIAVVESVPAGVIPSAMVRTESGHTRRVRTIDLEPVADG